MAEKSDLTIHDVYKLYDSFIRDNKIDELELGLTVPNIFEVLKITNREIRHSNFLAWLLLTFIIGISSIEYYTTFLTNQHDV